MRISRSLIGNTLTLLLLTVLAWWLLRLQIQPWPSLTPLAKPRWIAAIATVIWLAHCGWIAWRGRTPKAIATTSADGETAWRVVYASQTGFALELAQRTMQALRDAGCHAELHDIARLGIDQIKGARCLFVVSTTGEGDPPDHALGFAARMTDAHDLHGTQYAVLALGDREYEQFCAFGRQLDDWLHHHGATRLFDRVDIDNADPGALRHWQSQIGVLTGHTHQPDWERPQYQRWTLAARTLLNPGSAGDPAFHIALTPPVGETVDWQAGDIAEIGPRDPHNPDAEQPHREYSIASIPADGELHLLVRLMQREDGSPGLGSGWLCAHAAVGEAIDLRIRSNPNFHAPEPSRPMILIGNGTGLAGLRAHLKARIATGAHRNWLLFGERNAAHDRFHGDELDGWLHAGKLAHLDRVYSRDGGAHRYVQDALRANAARLRQWLDDGAALYVCGSLQGMAPGVDAVLTDLLGKDGVDALIEAGRYRRDVY
ncbi:MAG: sulfite reductase subunit alpha [Thermomonas sp.]|uniref:sulfite reductase subunit alpha n=1 Tax=Thermomonas sp. TaxID=1971895 RepID=UPI0039E51ECF